jgi:hypothetical protein
MGKLMDNGFCGANSRDIYFAGHECPQDERCSQWDRIELDDEALTQGIRARSELKQQESIGIEPTNMTRKCLKCGDMTNWRIIGTDDFYCLDCMPSANAPGIYERLARDVGQLVDEKQAAYGDSFGAAPAFLRLLWPDGVGPDQYDDLLTIVRIFDKLKRIATNKDAFGESPYRDIGGYALLGMWKDEKEMEGK